jgi:hypothetical protein
LEQKTLKRVGASETQRLTLAELPGLKMVDHLMNNLQIILFEGPNSLINFALSKAFDEHLLLARPHGRIWEELVE